MFAAPQRRSSVSQPIEPGTCTAPRGRAQRVPAASVDWQRLATRVPVSEPHDPDERQADRVADALVQDESARIGLATAPTAVQRRCAACEEEEQEREGDMPVRRRAEPDAGGQVAGPEGRATPAQPITSGGEPLSAGLRSYFEPRLGLDLGEVRLHTGGAATESARAFGARAYTYGTHVVFGPGGLDTSSAQDRHLLAHELAHVAQQTGQRAPLVQRQESGDKPWIPIPIFDQFDPCIITPQGKVCGSDAKKACEKAPFLPGCHFLCKKLGCKKSDKKIPICPPGWEEPGAKDFKGLCCPQGDIPDPARCCPPDRVAMFDGRCCKSDEQVVNHRCEKQTKPEETCPPERRAWGGRCCEPPLVPQGFACVEPGKQPKRDQPPPQPKPPVVRQVLRIGFLKDAPQTWYDPRSSFRVSVTADGKADFETLVAALKADPKLRVELSGHASIEKPATDPTYNDRLSVRRVQLIRDELMRRGIDAGRLGTPPGETPVAGCQTLSAGLLACGDSGAAEEPTAEDRNVAARVFMPGP